MSLSKWEQHGIEKKLLNILRDLPEDSEGHHFGQPFLTAYQIAIEFAQRHPEVTEALAHPVGGKGIGVHYSLASYLAQRLSVLIKDKRIPVEGIFLSNKHLHAITFDHDDELITSSLTGTNFTLSMFRLQMTFQVTAWNNGSHHTSGAGYGLKISIVDRDRYFDSTWKSVLLHLEGKPEPIEINIDKQSFWGSTCRELISREIGVWLQTNNLAPWPKSHPPKFTMKTLGNRQFDLRSKA